MIYITYPPVGHFEPHTYYHAKVRLFANNPEHDAVLYSGFLNKGGFPFNYAKIFNPTYDSLIDATSSAYPEAKITVVRKMFTEDEAVRPLWERIMEFVLDYYDVESEILFKNHLEDFLLIRGNTGMARCKAISAQITPLRCIGPIKFAAQIAIALEAMEL